MDVSDMDAVRQVVRQALIDSGVVDIDEKNHLTVTYNGNIYLVMMSFANLTAFQFRKDSDNE